MKIMITWLHKNGKCRSLTNSNPEEHTCMALTVWVDAMKRIVEKWGKTPVEAAEDINKMFRNKGENCNEYHS